MSDVHALLVIDCQVDFTEGGSLPVAGGADVARAIARLIQEDGDAYDLIVFTADWHRPEGNGDHFEQFPPHCVMNTEGAKLHPDLDPHKLPDFDPDQHVFLKGDGEAAFSGFQGTNVQGYDLNTFLRIAKVTHVDVCGLALDYCVKVTALDARAKGFDTEVIGDMTAAVDPEQIVSVIQELRSKGITVS